MWSPAQGQIEPVSEDIKLGSELSGKLKFVNVEEGDPVRKGQVLAVLENDDYRAELASASRAGARKGSESAQSHQWSAK